MKNIFLDEKSRIDEMLKQGRLTPEEHQTLVGALGNDPGLINKTWDYFINPFQTLSTLSILLTGFGSILLMSLIGEKLGLHFGGILDFKIIENGKPTYSGLQLLGQNIVNIFSITIFFFVGSLICRRKNLRVVDFISTVTFSRLPYALFTLTLFLLEPIFPRLLPKTPSLQNSPGLMVLVLFAIAFLAWEITLLFSALKEASGLKTKALWKTFIIGLVLAEVTSYSIYTYFLK